MSRAAPRNPPRMLRRPKRLLGVLSLVLACWWVGPVPAEEPTELTVGVFPRRTPEITEKLFAPLASHLAAQLGRGVRLETAPDFVAFWEAVEAGRYDLLHYNQYHYVRSHAEGGYRAIVQNEERGHDTIVGMVVARKDSGLTSLQDLKGQKVVFGGGRTAMVSHIVARHLLQQAGLEEGSYFTQFALTPPKACVALHYRQAAAAGVGEPVFDVRSVRALMDRSDIRVLAASEPLAHLPWAVKPTLDAEVAERIREILIGLKATEQGRALLHNAGLTGLNAVSDEDYDPHRQIIWEVLGEDYRSSP